MTNNFVYQSSIYPFLPKLKLPKSQQILFMKRIFFCCCFSISSLSISCFAQTETTLKPYYFPYQNFFEPVVYKYVNTENANDIFYCFLETKVIAKDTIIVSSTFDQAFYEVDAGTEKITPQGIELKTYTIYVSGVKIPTRPIHKDIFRWQQNKEDKIKWSARYRSPFGEESIRKMREYLGNRDNYSFQQKDYPSIAFKDTYRHSIKADKSVRTTDFHQEARYCKGIGLVDYQREMENGVKLHYKLEKIISNEAWEVLKKQPYSIQKPIKRT